MRLCEGKAGRYYEVETVIQGKLGEEWTKRLQSLGVVRNTEILILNRKKSGAVAVKIRGTRLAIGRKLAEAIEIRLVEGEAAEPRKRGETDS